MKQTWLTLAMRIDRLSLRQRVGLFGAGAALLLYLMLMLALDPLLREQARLRQQIGQQGAAIAAVDSQLSALVAAFARDPDAPSRQRLAAAGAETQTLGAGLAAMQQGLVAPQQMVPLLESILRANGRLQLVALTVLPVSTVGAAALAPAAVSTTAPTGLLYRHGVQLTVRGSYLDMVDTMAALERLPTRLFWGPLQLQVEEHPRAQLTLTLYTLSMDSKWLKL